MEETCVYCGAELIEGEEKCSCGRTREEAKKESEERASNAGEKTIEEYMNVDRTCEFCANTREEAIIPNTGKLICTIENRNDDVRKYVTITNKGLICKIENPRPTTDGVCPHFLSHIMKAKYKVDIRFLTRAINHSPTANDYRNRGFAYMQINEISKAHSDISMALHLDPYDIEAQKIRDELEGKRH